MWRNQKCHPFSFFLQAYIRSLVSQKKLGFPSMLISSMKSNGLDELHLYYLEHLNALALAMTLALPINKHH
jgi:hypothetical protein